MLKGLRTAVYQVADVAEARDWYARTLGIQPYFDQPFYVGFNVGGFELGLHPGAPPPAEQPGATDVYWGVDDVAAALAHFLAAGAARLADIQDVGDGIKLVTVRDPFGNRFGLIENPHFGA
jgi:predicted enzyme related to lactoylglutathione lyase